MQSVYWRTYTGPAAITLPDPEQTMIARHDARSLWESLFSVLRCRWVNSHKAFLLHQCKPAALSDARLAAGLRLVDQIEAATPTPEEVSAFAKQGRLGFPGKTR